MLIANDNIQFESGETFDRISTPRFDVYWRGFVYVQGCAAGKPSIEHFIARLASIDHEAPNLRGVYFLALYDKAERDWSAFVDSAGLFHAYHSADCIGTSFLGLAERLRLGVSDFDPEALVEFLNFGCNYEERTLFPRVRKIAPDEIVKLAPATRCVKQKKGTSSTRPEASLTDVLREFAAAAAAERISVDLTGGIDSRLLAVSLSYFGLPFEVAASGNEHHPDAHIATEVARALGREFHLTRHRADQTDWSQVFRITDGCFDLEKAGRPIQLQIERAARGITLAVSGAGGELYKDFWWLQDFPFYSRKHPALDRLIAFRIAPATLPPGFFAPALQTHAREFRDRLRASLQKYVVEGNTKTYDRIYYEYKMRGFAGRFLTNSAHILNVHTPYLEPEAFRFGYRLPRAQRFFNRYHRELITRFAPQVARLHTTEGGMTASAETAAIARDLAFYGADRAKRLSRKLAQRTNARVRAGLPVNDSAQPHILRELARERRTLERLRDCGIVGSLAELECLGNAHVGKLLALQMTIEALQSANQRNSAAPADQAA